jgi:excisionase family DNA binding protein
MSQNQSQVLTVVAAAELLSVSKETVRKLIEAGDIVAANVGSPGKRKSYRILQCELIKFLRSKQVKVPAIPPAKRLPRTTVVKEFV